jgi:hypothetical protein
MTTEKPLFPKELKRMAKSRAKSRKVNGEGPPDIDLAYERGMGVRVRHMHGELLLAKARQEVLTLEEVQRQAEFVATILRQQILAFPAKYAPAAARELGLPNERQLKKVFDGVAHSVCNELSHFYEKVTDANWLKE